MRWCPVPQLDHPALSRSPDSSTGKYMRPDQGSLQISSNLSSREPTPANYAILGDFPRPEKAPLAAETEAAEAIRRARLHKPQRLRRPLMQSSGSQWQQRWAFERPNGGLGVFLIQRAPSEFVAQPRSVSMCAACLTPDRYSPPIWIKSAAIGACPAIRPFISRIYDGDMRICSAGYPLKDTCRSCMYHVFD